MKATHKKWLVMLALTLWANACMCIGDIPETEQKTLAEAQVDSNQTSFEIEYDFLEKRFRVYDSPCYNRDRTSVETIRLTAKTPSNEKPLALTLMNQRNKEGKRPYEAFIAEIVPSPTGDRVAYKVGDSGWQLVHVMPDIGLLQAPKNTLKSKPNDWSKIPTLEDHEHIVALFVTHNHNDGIYTMLNRGRMFRHLKQNLSDDEYARVLAKLANTEVVLDFSWTNAVKQLTPESLIKFGAQLAEVAVRPDASPYVINRAAPYITFASPEEQALARKAPRLLMQHERIAGWSDRNARIYLREFARQDAQAASVEACALLTEGWKDEKYRYPGRLGRVTLVTITGNSPMPPCPILEQLLPEDACAKGWAKPDGTRLTPEELEKILADEVALERAPDKVRADIDGHFILAAMHAKQMTLPDDFGKPCPARKTSAENVKSTTSPPSATAPEPEERDQGQERGGEGK